MLGLPDGITALLFDLDGVLTHTAELHAEAWKRTFDDLLRELAAERGEPFREFALPGDYDAYVDGLPRLDGVRSFLRSRGIELPEGGPDDPPGARTVHGVGSRKNDLVLALMRERGVRTYDGSVRYVEVARDRGLRRAVVSSSANAGEVLRAAGLDGLFDAVVDGHVAEREGCRGKPAPDTFLAGARMLGAQPREAAVFEDALAGVEAGRAGDFGRVVGVDRTGQADALRAHGADIVVGDLAELLGEDDR